MDVALQFKHLGSFSSVNCLRNRIKLQRHIAGSFHLKALYQNQAVSWSADLHGYSPRAISEGCFD